MIKLTLQFKGKPLKVFPVKSNRLEIGRDAACDITIDNLALSPLHAVIEIENEDVVITDKSDSTEETGVVVNASKIKQQTLKHNDVVYLGKYSLKVTQEDSGDSVLQDTGPEPAPVAPAFPKAEKIPQGWLQIMSGPKLGRTIKLEGAMMRIGKTGKTCAMISCRDNKYYIVHLEGEPKTRVGNKELGEERQPLKDGDTLTIGETRMLFFLE